MLRHQTPLSEQYLRLTCVAGNIDAKAKQRHPYRAPTECLVILKSNLVYYVE